MTKALEEQAPPRPRSRRTKKRWIGDLVTLLIALGLIGLIWVGWLIFQGIRDRIPQDEANIVRSEYLEAMRGMEDIVEDVAIVADLLTDPTQDSDGAGQGLVVIAQLRSHADVIATVARRPLPEVPDWTDQSHIEALVPIQDQLMRAVSQAEVISRRLEAITAYREAFALMFDMPPLTLTIVGDDIEPLRVDLNAMIERTESALEALPNIPELTEHRAAAVQVTSRLRSWRDDYLDALILGDVGAAGALQGEMEGSIADVRAALADPLTELGDWADEAVDDLRSELDTARQMIEGQLAGSSSAATSRSKSDAPSNSL